MKTKDYSKPPKREVGDVATQNTVIETVSYNNDTKYQKPSQPEVTNTDNNKRELSVRDSNRISGRFNRMEISERLLEVEESQNHFIGMLATKLDSIERMANELTNIKELLQDYLEIK
ncbi:MAG: hypothetical protein GY861_22715 [bacterium]|nr:hypothetical protein [bacterium]